MTGILTDQQLAQEHSPRSPKSISHRSKPVLPLDGFLIGHIMTDLNGKIAIVNSDGDQFILPDCRIISADKSLKYGFVVDIEYHQLSKYQTNDHISRKN